MTSRREIGIVLQSASNPAVEAKAFEDVTIAPGSPSGGVHEDRDAANTMAIESLPGPTPRTSPGSLASIPLPAHRTMSSTDFGHSLTRAGTIIVSFACPASYLDTARQLFADEVLPALRA